MDTIINEQEYKPQYDHETIQSAVTEYIREMILQGRISPGKRIRQADLAKELGVSTTPVREALRQLVTHGLLDFVAHRGVMVHRTSREELIDLYETRMALEPIALNAVTKRITPGEIERLKSLLDEMEREKNIAHWFDLNARFHSALIEASGRPLLVSILRNLQDISALYVMSSLRSEPGRMLIANKEHRQILEACITGDSDGAEKAILSHLQRTLMIDLPSYDGYDQAFDQTEE